MGAERIKGVFNTDEGAIGYNIAGDSIAQSEQDSSSESRTEIITPMLRDEWGKKLLECVIQSETDAPRQLNGWGRIT